MITAATPLRTTLVFGLGSALMFIPLHLFFSTILSGLVYSTLIFRLVLWTYLGLYAVLLARWGKQKNLVRVLFPLAFLLAAVFAVGTRSAFLLIFLAVLSWIRSGICFPGAVLKTVAAEVLVCFGGAGLVSYFNPHSLSAWAMGIWLFFLIQALYFLFREDKTESKSERSDADPFETARKGAEKILFGER